MNVLILFLLLLSGFLFVVCLLYDLSFSRMLKKTDTQLHNQLYRKKGIKASDDCSKAWFIISGRYKAIKNECLHRSFNRYRFLIIDYFFTMLITMFMVSLMFINGGKFQ